MKPEHKEHSELSERNRRILHDLIEEYIHTGEPVGSRILSKKSTIDLSAATVRNSMADLEEMGYLLQPHISAGRIPTEKAFRFYVDSILEVRPLMPSEKLQIKEKYKVTQMEISEILKETSQLLSDLSKNVSVVVVPRFIATVFKLIEFINLSKDRILVIFVSQSGIVQNKLIEVDEEIPQRELDKYSRYLNELLKGLSLHEVKQKIVAEMQKEKTRFDGLISQALQLSKKALEVDAESEVYVEGKLTIFDYPEFSETETMKRILHAFEEKERLLKLLTKAMEARGVQIFIGSENELQEMEGCSLVTSTYWKGKYVLGTLGVIGPTRMDYERIIPIVDYTARMVSRLLQWK